MSDVVSKPPLTIKTVRVATKDLRFDEDNPRLPEHVERKQPAIFRYLVEEIGVDDLLPSMAAQGFVSADPFIGEKTGKTVKVMEGNRRLAAVRLLLGDRPHGIGIQVPPIAEGKRGSLEKISVQFGWEEDALEAYLGYKHVTAAREWGPEAKARYVLKVTHGDLSDESLRAVGRRIGAQLGTLKRWLGAHLLLEQARDEGLVDPKRLENGRFFGTLYTLLSGENTQKFLGVNLSAPKRNPSSKPSEVKEYLSWVVPEDGKKPVVNSRNQKQLEEVLGEESALHYFRTRRDLEGALKRTTYQQTEIADRLRDAAETVRDTLSHLRDLRDKPGVLEAFEELQHAVGIARFNLGLNA